MKSYALICAYNEEKKANEKKRIKKKKLKRMVGLKRHYILCLLKNQSILSQQIKFYQSKPIAPLDLIGKIREALD